MISGASILPMVRILAWITFLTLWAAIGIKDWREKRILHRYLLYGFWVVLVGYSLILAGTFMGGRGWIKMFYQWPFYRDLLAHLLISCLAALAMWRAEIWPAGDTKLFMLLAAVFPLLEISGPFHAGWLFLIALINIFIPASLAVFFHSVHFVWSTRLKHYQGFLRQMGWAVEFDYLRQNTRESARVLSAKSREALTAFREDPWTHLRDLGGWALTMFVMALISTALKGFIDSPLLRTLLCFAFLFIWGRVDEFLGSRWAQAAAVTGVGLIIINATEVFWKDVWGSFGILTFFGTFLYLGVKWTMGLLAGQMVMLILPFVGVLGGILPLAFSWSFPDVSLPRTLFPFAVLGAFFGLSFALVRICDDSDHPEIPLENLLTYMVLHRKTHARLREDPEFYEEFFASTYADGLTAEQVVALKDWCPRHQMATVALTKTHSFSHWIFLGYFLTWVLRGHVLQGLY